MNETLGFLMRHGYTVLFVWVFAEQIGLPLPAVPILIATGALAGGLDGWRKLGYPLATGTVEPETVNRRRPKKATGGVGLICLVKS